MEISSKSGDKACSFGESIELLGRLARGVVLMMANRLLDRKSAAAPQLAFRPYGGRGPVEGSIPRRIWIYWDRERLPPFIEKCVDATRRFNPDFEVNLLHPGNIGRFIAHVPPKLSRLTVQKQANWFRLHLLHVHGGIWMDASIMPTRSMDWVLDVQQAQASELVGFYLERYTTKPQTPVLENWFLAAVPSSSFVSDWLRTYTSEIVEGGVDAYLRKLRASGIFEELVQAIGMPEYLVMHLLAQELMQNGLPSRLSLARAEDCAFFYHQEAGWDRKKLHAQLLFRPAAGNLPYFVKLRGIDRRRFDRYISAGVYLRDSVVGIAAGR